MADTTVALMLIAAGAVTFGLRAVPFLAAAGLRDSDLMRDLGAWMPAGILTILALATLADLAGGGDVVAALLAVAVTVAVHLGLGRRALLSIGAGTATYVLLLQWLA